ncbi:M48 family metalloprotease [Marinivivus vitaminiproducens]|uniref:M48 family metalloprotease n=1 Tax=Marinivivus vitaminiproducens TaxID=3035935 RepID=UPI00279BD149|nr:M48 family metalloprotease [Geminicoccaceae bacterium SCSIO 64248]
MTQAFGRCLAALALTATLGLAAACSSVVNPATGETQYTSMTPEQERQIGQQENRNVLAEYGGAYESSKVSSYVTGVGNRLAGVSDTPGAEFTFTVLNSSIVNAFALPGGYVYVSRGLLALANDEAELAGVLAHEIGHVTARHTAQRYDRSQAASIGVLGATILGAVLGGDMGAQVAQQLGGAGAQAYIQGYSRDQEFQADELGVRYLARTDYDPVAMASFLTTLGRNDELTRQEGQSEGPSWLASHPRTPDRVLRAAEEAEATSAGGEERNRERYLAAIDGMVYGDDPSQGIVRGREFVHPELRFAFTAPPGFTLINQPSQVAGTDGQGRVMIFDMGPNPNGLSPARYITQEWAAQGNPQDVESARIDGKPAARARVIVTANGRQSEADIYAIQSGSNMYRFTFVAGGRMGGDTSRAFQEAATSFRTPSQSEIGNARPQRIRIHTVRSGETSSSLAQQMAVEDRKQETFEVINNLQPGTPVQAGQKVKLIVRG